MFKCRRCNRYFKHNEKTTEKYYEHKNEYQRKCLLCEENINSTWAVVNGVDMKINELKEKYNKEKEKV